MDCLIEHALNITDSCTMILRLNMINFAYLLTRLVSSNDISGYLYSYLLCTLWGD